MNATTINPTEVTTANLFINPLTELAIGDTTVESTPVTNVVVRELVKTVPSKRNPRLNVDIAYKIVTGIIGGERFVYNTYTNAVSVGGVSYDTRLVKVLDIYDLEVEAVEYSMNGSVEGTLFYDATYNGEYFRGDSDLFAIIDAGTYLYGPAHIE